jgi:uncharacterized protein YcfJ
VGAAVVGDFVGNFVGDSEGESVGFGVGGVGELVGTLVVGDFVGESVTTHVYPNCPNLQIYPSIHPGYSKHSSPGLNFGPNGLHFFPERSG